MPTSYTFPPCTIPYPLEFYIDVYLSRFPTHKLFPFILESHIIEEVYSEDRKERRIKRRIHLDIDAPSWIKTLTGLHYSVFIEDTHINYSTHHVHIKTVNESFSNKVVMTDITDYSPHADNPNWTVFVQTGTVDFLVHVFGLQKKIEEFVMGLYKSRYDESRVLDNKMIELYISERGKSESSSSNSNNSSNITTDKSSENNSENTEKALTIEVTNEDKTTIVENNSIG
eukprot:TRINITY_DN231_c0_g1_i1.p1 TRINITY_DN231_c0_g1~~TRINITY_DN231_c0_g1_i1.p1  ORF type:complete len:228 (+),score=52.33 TRINITY_DN231_c0_g1_i1:357-1040(+)